MLRVLHYVSVMDRGGQETFIMNLFRKIDRSQIQFDFLCSEMRPGECDTEIHELGGHIHYVKPVSRKGLLKHLEGILVLGKQLRQMPEPYDVFHIHNHHAFSALLSVLAAKLGGVKTIVVHSHNTSTQYHLQAHAVCKRILAWFNVRRFACSQAAGEWMFTSNNFTVIHNGLDLNEFTFDPWKREEVRKEFNWTDKRIIGHVGRFNAQKNHMFLIEIFAALHEKMQDAHLVLVGKGELEDEVRRRVEEKGLSDFVSFLGVRDDVQRLYQGMDLFLFPSCYEGLGIVLIEAQICGLPCVVSDVIPSESIFVENTVKMSLQSSSELWAEKCMLLLKNVENRNNNVSVLRSAGYDSIDIANNLERIYLM